MTADEMLRLLDESIAKAEGQGKRKRDYALMLRGAATILPSLGGWTGTWAGEDERGAAYAFTLRQCREMRDGILAAAREDARAAGLL